MVALPENVSLASDQAFMLGYNKVCFPPNAFGKSKGVA